MNKGGFVNFHNDGFGWICKKCAAETETEKHEGQLSRLMREGEAESKLPRFSNAALARWADESRRTLICPRCQTIETAQ